jgi:uncharacterized OB-fold protein
MVRSFGNKYEGGSVSMSANSERVIEKYPIIDGLFTWPSENPKLIAGRCKTCEAIFFPSFHHQHKPTCRSADVEEILLGNRGTLASYTVMHVPPPPIFGLPDCERPYAIGLIKLPEGLKIAGIVEARAVSNLRVNMDVEIMIDTLYEDEKGNEALTWKIRPVL